MKADSIFSNKDLSFWANVRFIGQKLGYSKKDKISVPEKSEILQFYSDFQATISEEIIDSIHEYLQFRSTCLQDFVQHNLMREPEARELFNHFREQLNPKCPLPLNKQSGEKKNFAYFTCQINMRIEHFLKGKECDYDPRQIPVFTENNFPVRSLSRRVDGCFPSPINPVAIWEIKEYYYTTSFGSRIADGVYETQLDGMELKEIRQSLNFPVLHYLMIDAYDTWWLSGKSYLCRIVDMLHMGLVTEVLFGREIIEGVPRIVEERQKTNNHT
jgi:hypothetical protein